MVYIHVRAANKWSQAKYTNQYITMFTLHPPPTKTIFVI